MSSQTVTETPAQTQAGQGKGQFVTLSGEDLLYPQGFTFFHNRVGHFPGQEEPIKKIRYPKYGNSLPHTLLRGG